jgi:enterochelin esterase-like enzyme
MKPLAMALLFLFCVFCMAMAQDSSRPASTNARGAEYPRVHPNGRVTFRVLAPTAQKVQVAPGMTIRENNGLNGLGENPFDMVRDKDGYWTVTTPPAVPGFHYYWLLVDGVAVNDPSSDTFIGYSKPTSGIEVPEPGVDFYYPKDVPHGEVRERWFHSDITGDFRRICVYTPPDYDANPKARYPVFYLQHGGSMSETSWVRPGKANLILDNLIAANKAVPMIIVMSSGYAVEAGAPTGSVTQPPVWTWSPEKHDFIPPPGVSADFRPKSFQDGWTVPPPNNPFERVLVREVIPLVDKTYRTIADRDHRAMAGLSMGSRQTLQITLHNLDVFSYIGVFSRPPLPDFDIKTYYGGVLANGAGLNKRVHLLWFGAGTAEEGIWVSLKATREALDKAGVKYVYIEYPGLAHEWQIWRKSLYDFAPRLFQAKQVPSAG